MKKLFVSLAALVVAMSAFAQSSDWTVRNVRDPVQLQQKLNTDGAAVEARVAALEVPQIDTNATTTVTAYTPRRIGDVLLGGKGEGTNLVCVSKGTTTNDWVQLVP